MLKYDPVDYDRLDYLSNFIRRRRTKYEISDHEDNNYDEDDLQKWLNHFMNGNASAVGDSFVVNFSVYRLF